MWRLVMHDGWPPNPRFISRSVTAQRIQATFPMSGRQGSMSTSRAEACQQDHPSHGERAPHPPKTPRVQSVMDEYGERIVVLFPCECCGDPQHYNVLNKCSTCFRCDGIAPARNESTAA